jgi:catechol 2,3-dioxygenase-like lactoylglutathione lyase family enzyme
MKRLHVHVSVDNLADSIQFYTGMFATGPTVIKTDYAKWMLDDPRVNFAISQRGLDAGLNHLGIQVESAAELGEMEGRLKSLQAPLVTEENASCCYAKSDKYWVEDPSGIAWETFHTLDTIPVFGEHAAGADVKSAAGNCCIPLAKTEGKSSCCVPEASGASNKLSASASDRKAACC